MGLLALGTPLAWDEAKTKADHVRNWGIQQLLSVWNRAKGKHGNALLWGDEVEYIVVCLNDEKKEARLSLRQSEILLALAHDAELQAQGGCVPAVQTVGKGKALPTFHPEFGRYMLESTPGAPWSIGFEDLLDVETNMEWRRRLAKDHMAPTEFPVTMTTFPRLGAPGPFTTPYHKPTGDKSRSQFLPDEIINPHIRFPTLAANIRSRRGRKVAVHVPIFHDENTPTPWSDPTVDYDRHLFPEDDDVRNGAVKPDHIYMDGMGFGMGSCCLQITFQAQNIREGRMLYDQLSPLGPIFLALTAATPLYKGFVADTDVRWNQISAAVDDRTPEELGEAPLKHDRWRIPKSRYASNSTYISEDPRLRPEYLDPGLIVDEKIKQELIHGGMDDLLATHFAHLFIRDPIVIFSEDLKTLDLSKTDHFENLQSTNWQHMRFKPPPNDESIGWRVEFRSMEVQATDFENAAFSVFLVLLTRTILSFDLNFYIPIARVTENMETAHAKDAVLNKKFWFRKNPFGPPRGRRSGLNGVHHAMNGVGSGRSTPTGIRTAAVTAAAAAAAAVGGIKSAIPLAAPGSPTRSRPSSRSSTPGPPPPLGPVEDEYELMTIDEIMNGTKRAQATSNPNSPLLRPTSSSNEDLSSTNSSSFIGLIPLVENYLDSVNIDLDTKCSLARYLNLLKDRASGKSWTCARWIREFVQKHPDYKKDSVVTDRMCYDLSDLFRRLGNGETEVAPEMFGHFRS